MQTRDRVSRVAAECVLSVVVWDAPNRILESPCFLGEVKVDLVKEFGKEWLTQEISRAFKLSDPDFRSETEHRERRLKARGSHFHDQLELGFVDPSTLPLGSFTFCWDYDPADPMGTGSFHVQCTGCLPVHGVVAIGRRMKK